jgi:hypothetical protein
LTLTLRRWADEHEEAESLILLAAQSVCIHQTGSMNF